MTAKRFIIMDNLPKGTHSNIWDKQKQHNQGIGDELWLGEVVAMLNEGVILAEENEELKQQIKHSQKRTAIISGWLHDEGNLTLKKYEEILDYCYQQYKKEVLND